MENLNLVFSDLDGTLLKRGGAVSESDLMMLKNLGKHQIVRVLATGRNLWSLQKVIPADFPVDFVIFSTGAGVINWRTGDIIYKKELPVSDAMDAIQVFISHETDFMIHDEIPENHRFAWFFHGHHNPDFFERVSLYEPFSRQWDGQIMHAVTQLVGITSNGKDVMAILSANQNIQLVRTTSPLDGKTTWLEIFTANVSKGHTAKWLCDRLGVSMENTLSVGNDYNDTDLLDMTGKKFIVSDAPADLLAKYPIADATGNCGFTNAVNRCYHEMEESC